MLQPDLTKLTSYIRRLVCLKHEMKYQSTVLGLMLLLIASSVAQAQTDSLATVNKKNQISFSIGPHLGYLKDLNFSPLNYRERGILLSLDYNRKNSKESRLFTTELNFHSGKLKTRSSDFFTTPFLQASLKFAFLFKVQQTKQKKLSLFLGSEYQSFVQYMQWGEEMDSWNYLMLHGFSLKALGEYQITGNKNVQISLSVPFLGNLVRPPYNGFDQYIVEHQDDILKIAFRGELASFTKYRAIDWKTIYHYTATDHLGFTFGYTWRYQYVPGPNKMKSFQNLLTTGFRIKF